jgi:hypothetical protein
MTTVSPSLKAKKGRGDGTIVFATEPFYLKNGGLKLKHAPGFKEHPILLIALFLACAVFFASCSGDISSNASSIAPASKIQTATIIPIGAQATCLTIHSPSLVKLADGQYELVDEIDNCAGKDAGPLKITSQIETETTTQSPKLMGPATILANRKAMYHTFAGQTGGTSQEIHFPSPLASSAVVTVSVTINGAVQGEWDGQVTIPA